MLAGDEAALAIDSVAVLVTARVAEDGDRAVGLVEAQQTIVGDVGPDEITPGREISGTFGPAAAGPELLQVDVAEDEAAEALVLDLKNFRQHARPAQLVILAPRP